MAEGDGCKYRRERIHRGRERWRNMKQGTDGRWKDGGREGKGSMKDGRSRKMWLEEGKNGGWEDGRMGKDERKEEEGRKKGKLLE